MGFVAKMYSIDPATAARRSETYMEALAVSPFADQLAEGYSHGMKQRVVLAAALLHEPQVLIVDEPMVGLDPRTVRSVKELFGNLAKDGRTVFMSTHTLDVAEAIADRIAIIHHGRIIACGTLAELRAKATQEYRPTGRKVQDARSRPWWGTRWRPQRPGAELEPPRGRTRPTWAW